MVSLLVVFSVSCWEDGLSLGRVISELFVVGGFKSRNVSSQFIVSAYLVQCVLVSKELILSETQWFSTLVETVHIVGSKVLRPTSRMVPMAAFQNVLLFFVDNLLLLSDRSSEHSLITSLKSCVKLSYFEVSLSHLYLLSLNIELGMGTLNMGREMLLLNRVGEDRS